MGTISDFYKQVLGAHLSNTRWSWGAVDRENNRIYLRLWKHDITRLNGSERILVARSVQRPGRKSPGFPERKNHLQMLRDGAQGFGIVCVAKNPKTDDVRTIESFDEQILLKLGKPERHGSATYSRILDRIPVADLARRRTSQSELVEDLWQLRRLRGQATERQQLASARVGQGQFRFDVLRLWGGACAVTGCRVLEVVRASHIKPWRDSTDQERLDPENGLPLAAHLDALFDAGWITFESNGWLLVSPRLDPAAARLFELKERRLARSPTGKTPRYLQQHRESVFRSR